MVYIIRIIKNKIEIKLRGRLDKKNMKELIDMYDAQQEVIINVK